MLPFRSVEILGALTPKLLNLIRCPLRVHYCKTPAYTQKVTPKGSGFGATEDHKGDQMDIDLTSKLRIL